MNLRYRVTGNSPTTLEAKVWLGSDPEPTDWMLTATDGHPALQAPGGVGFSGYISGSATAVPVIISIDRLVATP